MRVIAGYEGDSSMKVSEHALAFMAAQENSDDQRMLYLKPNFPDILSGDWVGVQDAWLTTKYGIVTKVEVDERPGWEESAEIYHVHIVEDNMDVTCWPTELVSHAPMCRYKKINEEIGIVGVRKDMIKATNTVISLITNVTINWI